jgi:hypothetical protein
MVNNKNLFRESVVFGNFVNADDIKVGGNQANAKFKRNVLVGGDLTLGLETSTTTNGLTTYTNTGGNILVKKNGITYVLTPTILSHLSTINDNIQDQIDNITTPDLSSYAPKANPSFTGNVTIGETSSDNLTINSKIYAKNGIVYPTLVYTAITTEYNRFFGNFIMFMVASPPETQLLPSIPAGTNSSTIKFFNNSNFPLTLTRQNDSFIYGLLGSGTASISLLPGYFYEITSMFSGRATYDNWLVTSVINSDGSKTFSTIPTYSGTDLANTLNDGTLATTKFVNNVLETSILTYIKIYCELGGNYIPVDVVANPSFASGEPFINGYQNDATYSSVNAIVGYSSINFTTAGVGQGNRYFAFGNFRNYTTNGYDTSLYGFNSLTGNWKCPQTGKYSICINFYIKSNNSGNKFSLNKYDSNNALLSTQYCLAGDTISTDTIRNFTTILQMNKDDYFKIVLTTYVGNAVMRFEGLQYTNMKIMLLSA